MRNLLLTLGLITFLGLNLQADLISEFQPNPAGTDPATQDIEFSGTPGAAISGFLLSLESDISATPGVVDRFETIGPGIYDPSGLFVQTITDLENPSFTLVFSSADPTGGAGVGFDVDTNDDGVVDSLGAFGTVFDAIGVPDTVGEILYGASLGGADFTFALGTEPDHVFREGSTGDWFQANAGAGVLDLDGADASGLFDPSAGPRFGAVNPIPEPSSFLFLGMIGLVGFGKRHFGRKN